MAYPFELNRSQREAYNKLIDFLQSPDPKRDLFLLQGIAGTGKSFLTGTVLSQFVEESSRPIILCAPTHKALKVAKRFLRGWGLDYIDAPTFGRVDASPSTIIVGTTAKMLGIRPVLVEKEDDSGEMVEEFKATGSGFLSSCLPSIVVIDEISMVSRGNLKALRDFLRGRNNSMQVFAGLFHDNPTLKLGVERVLLSAGQDDRVAWARRYDMARSITWTADQDGTDINPSKLSPTKLEQKLARMLFEGSELKALLETSSDPKEETLQTKILMIGDPGQLPPVKQKAIPFDKIPGRHKAILTEVVRQAEGSPITRISTAIYNKQPWDSLIDGFHVRKSPKLGWDFLQEIEIPTPEVEEESRSVFIAYRNARVDAVQDAACRKLYNHSAGEFKENELVVSERAFYQEQTGPDGREQLVLLIANQDELVIREIHPNLGQRVPAYPCKVSVIEGEDTFRDVKTYYLPKKDLDDETHPFNIELTNRLKKARGLSRLVYRLKDQTPLDERDRAFAFSAGLHPDFLERKDLEDRRRDAWGSYFEWKDRTLITFRHPFATTSHKSQGSTYGKVFADVVDLKRFDARALYVAVTRPREELIVN